MAARVSGSSSTRMTRTGQAGAGDADREAEAAGAADDVVLPAWTVQTVTGKPTAYEDAAFWTNEAMAQYFGVKSVRVE